MEAQLYERDKWILYKHTNNYELIKNVALVVKNQCKSNISKEERKRMQERLAALDLWHTRNPKEKPLDSINHRINTLEFFMFGYENPDTKTFIFSPLGNLFLKYLGDDQKQCYIFMTMLFGIQFEHPANGTPPNFQIYPFRLVYKLLTDKRLGYKLYHKEFIYFLPFVEEITLELYEKLVDRILDFRKLKNQEIIDLLLKDEHTYVKSLYEWQYYVTTLLAQAKVLDKVEGNKIVKLSHPRKPTSKSEPTKRSLKDGFVKIPDNMVPFVHSLLEESPFNQNPVVLNDPNRLKIDAIKEIYAYYPKTLLSQIGEDENDTKLLELAKLIETYSNNPENKTAGLFEEVLTNGFNMFSNVVAKHIGGSGQPDIECLYLDVEKKFAVEAKSTAKKLNGIKAGRLRGHQEKIGAKYTIVITSRYVPAIKQDIKGVNIVILLAHTFSEYLFNHIIHDIRDIDYKEIDDIVERNFGKDISCLVSSLTLRKFGTGPTSTYAIAQSVSVAADPEASYNE